MSCRGFFIKENCMKKYPIIIAGLITGWFLPQIVGDMSRLTVTRSEIRAKGLPEQFDGLKIVHLSDLHNKKYGANDAVLYRMICDENPDIVVMTGDMISHDGRNKEDFFGLVRRLGQKYPVFYVNGNHELSDMSAEEFRRYSARMKEYGAVCLDNAGIVLSRGEDRIRLYGLSYPARFYRGVREYKRRWSDFTIDDMRRYCGNAPQDFSILLAHNPLDFDVHAEWGADVSFGGHIHGGFIRLPLVGGVVSPDLSLFPKYQSGIYHKGKSTLVVSRGLGRIRFFNPPELVSVTLKCK